MNFKPSTNILSSSYYTRYKLQAPTTFSLGGASAGVNRIRKTPFYGPLRMSLKPRACTDLKWWQVAKNRVLRKVSPILKFAHI